jgi:FixJ family two-component response regulator
MSRPKLISVVDDDEAVRDSLPDLLRSFGFDAAPFSSAEEFLTSDQLDRTACLVLDVAMPGMTGPDLQQELIRQKRRIPIVFITAHSDETLFPKLLGEGAVACLIKPFNEDDIVGAVSTALGSG